MQVSRNSAVSFSMIQIHEPPKFSWNLHLGSTHHVVCVWYSVYHTKVLSCVPDFKRLLQSEDIRYCFYNKFLGERNFHYPHHLDGVFISFFYGFNCLGALCHIIWAMLFAFSQSHMHTKVLGTIFIYNFAMQQSDICFRSPLFLGRYFTLFLNI